MTSTRKSAPARKLPQREAGLLPTEAQKLTPRDRSAGPARKSDGKTRSPRKTSKP